VLGSNSKTIQTKKVGLNHLKLIKKSKKINNKQPLYALMEKN
jgi:hypothetical protein